MIPDNDIIICCYCDKKINLSKNQTALLCHCIDLKLATCVECAFNSCPTCKKQRTRKYTKNSSKINKANSSFSQDSPIRAEKQSKQIQKQIKQIKQQQRLQTCMNCQTKYVKKISKNEQQSIPFCPKCLMDMTSAAEQMQKNNQSHSLSKKQNKLEQKENKQKLKRQKLLKQIKNGIECSICEQKFYSQQKINLVDENSDHPLYICRECYKFAHHSERKFNEQSSFKKKQKDSNNSSLDNSINSSINNSNISSNKSNDEKKKSIQILGKFKASEYQSGRLNSSSVSNQSQKKQEQQIKKIKEQKNQQSNKKNQSKIQQQNYFKDLNLNRKIQSEQLRYDKMQEQAQQQDSLIFTKLPNNSKIQRLLLESHIQKKRKYSIEDYESQDILQIQLEEQNGEKNFMVQNKFAKNGNKVSNQVKKQFHSQNQILSCIRCNYQIKRKQGNYFDVKKGYLVSYEKIIQLNQISQSQLPYFPQNYLFICNPCYFRQKNQNQRNNSSFIQDQ